MNTQQNNRYARQIRLSEIGEEGQQKLLNASVLIIGMGGLGSPAAMYLAAAGVGHLIISDFDQVEESNLQRQIIHRNEDIGELKALSAKQTLNEINPQCNVEAIDWELDQVELVSYLKNADLVLDCSDNFPTRFAINRASIKTQTPLVSGAAIRMEGQVCSYLPGTGGPCYQCLYAEKFKNTETCAEEGVLSPVVGVIGTLQALMAIHILVGNTKDMNGKLMLFDGLSMDWQQVQINQNPNCPACGNVE